MTRINRTPRPEPLEPLLPVKRSQLAPPPLIWCILVSHEKAPYCIEAIHSVTNQSYPLWRLTIIDSGALLDQGYFQPVQHHPQVQLMREYPGYQEHGKSQFPWQVNQFMRSGQFSFDQNTVVVYLCDDDYWLPDAFASIAHAFRTLDVEAIYGHQDRTRGTEVYHESRALRPIGKLVGEKIVDIYDYAQFAHRANLLPGLYTRHGEYWAESKQHQRHADGITMERLGELTVIYPIDAKLSVNRRTELSTYNPISSTKEQN